MNKFLPISTIYEHSPSHRSIIHSQARTVLLRTLSPFASKRFTLTAGNIVAVGEKKKQSSLAWLQPNKQQQDNMSEQQQTGQRRNSNRNQSSNRNRSNNRNRSGRDSNNNGNKDRDSNRKPRQDKPKPLVLSAWQKFLIFCKLTSEDKIRAQLKANRPARSSASSSASSSAPAKAKATEPKPARSNTRVASEKKAPQQVDVETPRLYVGNLSYDATEYDIEDLFKGIGSVKKVEIIYNRHTHKSKGYGFVQMLNVDEATRAVEVLHDQPFLGRNLIVNGSKPRKESDPNSDDYADDMDASKEPAA